MYHRLLLSLLFWLAINGGIAFAQGAPDLIVTLKDINDKPIAGAAVIIRDSAGGRDSARATTDTQGVASFSSLMESDIRVAIQGQLPSGAKFFQPGNDAKGILMFLQQGTNHMDLLADTDGLIAPDPRTMSALEPGIPVATAEATVFPTAPVAATPTTTAIRAVPQLTFQALGGQAGGAGSTGGADLAGGAAVTEEGAAPTNPALIWLGVVGLTLLICAGISILLLQRRWRQV